MNHFDHESAAKRYAQSRPYFHPQVIGLIKNALGLEEKVEHALDVATGTGHSAQALLAIADKVTGTDLSNAMLGQVDSNAAIHFQQAPAESLPFEDNQFDLVTVCMAYHWFDQASFLAEAKRVLRKAGALAVYNCYFPGIMEGNPDYTLSNKAFYATFPAPARSEKHPTEVDAKQVGFEGVKESFEYHVHWDINQLTDYLCTQSAVIDQVEQGGKTLGAVIDDIKKRFKSYFSEERETFVFKGDVSIWRANC